MSNGSVRMTKVWTEISERNRKLEEIRQPLDVLRGLVLEAREEVSFRRPLPHKIEQLQVRLGTTSKGHGVLGAIRWGNLGRYRAVDPQVVFGVQVERANPPYLNTESFFWPGEKPTILKKDMGLSLEEMDLVLEHLDEFISPLAEEYCLKMGRLHSFRDLLARLEQ